ncbi:hypothetical protein LINGRAHAP2_LOCUS15014, partial [Linum grandiflorum]
FILSSSPFFSFLFDSSFFSTVGFSWAVFHRRITSSTIADDLIIVTQRELFFFGQDIPRENISFCGGLCSCPLIPQTVGNKNFQRPLSGMGPTLQIKPLGWDFYRNFSSPKILETNEHQKVQTINWRCKCCRIATTLKREGWKGCREVVPSLGLEIGLQKLQGTTRKYGGSINMTPGVSDLAKRTEDMSRKKSIFRIQTEQDQELKMRTSEFVPRVAMI